MSGFAEEKYDNMLDHFATRIAVRIKGPVHVRYSAYTIDSEHIPVNNLDEVPEEGTFRFYQEHDEFWDNPEFDGPGKDYESDPITNPTFMDICVLANEMIKTTHDTRHCFLEGIKINRSNPGRAAFIMGS